MIDFNRFSKHPWIDLLPSATERATAIDELRWLSLTRGNLQPSTDREICHLTLVHDETEDDTTDREICHLTLSHDDTEVDLD